MSKKNFPISRGLLSFDIKICEKKIKIKIFPKLVNPSLFTYIVNNK